MARDRQRAKQRKARQRPEPRAGSVAAASADAPSPLDHNVPSELGHLGEVDEFEAAIVRGAGGRCLRGLRRARRIPRPAPRPSGEVEDDEDLRRGARGAGRGRHPPSRAARRRRADARARRTRRGPAPLHRLPAGVVGRAAARTVARSPAGRAGHRRGHRLRRHRRSLPRRRRLGRQEDRRLHHLREEELF